MHPAPAIIPVILSGGAGTRLWPLSRESAPKPFMPLPDGDTLLAKTASRALALPGVAELVTVTNRDLYFLTRDVYAGLGDAMRVPSTFLLEPFGRNTAPAVALAALYVEAHHGAETVMLVLSADHLIRDRTAFALAVERAAMLARLGRLVTFGITPSHPETGFGYIQCGEAIAARERSAVPANVVQRFVEKPVLALAREYVADGTHVWNSGMFSFTPAAIIGAFARHAPNVLTAVRPIAQSLASANDSSMREIDAALFAAAPDVSIDYAVMEPAAISGEVDVVRGTFDWSDVGSWQAVSELSAADADGNRGMGERVAIATRGTFVHSEGRVVATVGVENLVIVDTPDAVLVAHRDHLQSVRDVVGELKARGHDAYKLHRTVSRPWGAYTVLLEGPRFKIKRIEVKPGGALSLQLHHRRSEHWVVVSGRAEITRGDESYSVDANESTFIPPGTRHRIANIESDPLVMIEVQCGEYLGEDDIVRFDDRYGRVKA